VLVITIAIVMPLALLVYAHIGTDFLSPSNLRHVVTERGFQSRWLWPLGFYFVPVNAVLEELFWRGVVLNELRGMDEGSWLFGVSSTLTFAAWHYLVWLALDCAPRCPVAHDAKRPAALLYRLPAGGSLASCWRLREHRP